MALTDNLTNYYKLDEASGNAVDTVSANNGVNTNVTYATGKINNGAVFRSANDAQLVMGSNITPTTIAFWINGTEFHSGATGYTVLRSTSPDHTLQGNANTGKILIYDGGSNRVASNNWATGGWHHYAFVYGTSPSNGYDIYLDGVFLERLASNQIQVRQFGRSGSLSFEGTIDELGLWSRALSAGEIASLYNGGSGLAYPFAVSVTASPSALSATFSLPSNTVTAIRNVTQSPSVLSATFSLPSRTVTAIQNVTQSPSVLSAVFSLPSRTVTAIENATISPSALSATFSIPAYSVVTPDAQVSVASPLTATFSLPASTVTAQRHITVDSSVLSASFSLPSSTQPIEVSNAPATLGLTFSIPAPTVTAERFVTVSSSVLAMTFSLPSSTKTVSVSIIPSVLALTFSLPSSGISTTRSVIVDASILTMLMSIPSPFVRGDFWDEKYPVASDPFTDKVYNENDNWTNKF